MINFNFGKKKPDKKQLIILSIVLSFIIAALSQCTKIPDHALWDLLDEVQRKYFPNGILNEIFIQDPEKLDRRINRDIDKAISDVIPEYDRIISDYDRKYKQRYVEEKNDESVCYTDACKALAPPMRICSVWVDDCPKD